MRERITQRIAELKKEFEAGQARLSAIDREAAQLRETMLRIAGAIQVLEETLASDDSAPAKQAAE